MRFPVDFLISESMLPVSLLSIFLNITVRSDFPLFVIKVDNRHDLMDFLQKNGIKCAIHYPKPFYETEAYRHINVSNCDTMNKYKNKLLSLPMYPELSGEEVFFACQKINDFYNKNKF